VAITKNYLSEDELQALNNLVEQYLVFAEGQAMWRIPMSMQDWIEGTSKNTPFPVLCTQEALQFSCPLNKMTCYVIM